MAADDAQLPAHPLFTGGAVGVMTADAPRYPAANQDGNAGLVRDAKAMGLKVEPTDGAYGAGPEDSFFVHGPSREQVYKLGKQYGQESVIFNDKGKRELLYTNGPNDGKAHPALAKMDFSTTPFDDYYTRVPGYGYVRMHFDLDTLEDRPGLK